MRSFLIAFVGAALVVVIIPVGRTEPQGWSVFLAVAGGLAIVGLVAGWAGPEYRGARWSYVGTAAGLGLLFWLDLAGVATTFWGASEETGAWMAALWPIVVGLILGLALFELAGYGIADRLSRAPAWRRRQEPPSRRD